MPRIRHRLQRRSASGICRLWHVAAATIALVAAQSLSVAAGESEVRVVTPVESDQVFANPGMGWQTFHCFADDDRNLAGLPSAAAYFRFYWADIEPREGEVDFARLDELLAHAHQAGQKLGIRIMCAASDRYYASPAWLKHKGCQGYEYHYQGAGPFWVPDYDDPLFREAHFRLIRELGKRYDGHPDLDYVDIGSVGLWGEWHMSGTEVEMPPLATRLAIVDAYIPAFPRTPKLMLIGDADAMAHAVARGCGWRADCLGDMGGFSPTWNHMRDAYPQQIEESGAGEAWRNAPVAWETCWDMRKWASEGWDTCYIFDYALQYHGSYVNNKSAPLPDGSRPMVERLLRRLGYRLVLRRLEHPPKVARGDELPITMHWENVGVAPPYRDYRLAFRLSRNDESGETHTSDVSIKGWLPGRREVRALLPIAANLLPGAHALSLAIVDPATGASAVKLAIEGAGPDGWYNLSQVEVTL